MRIFLASEDWGRMQQVNALVKHTEKHKGHTFSIQVTKQNKNYQANKYIHLHILKRKEKYLNNCLVYKIRHLFTTDHIYYIIHTVLFTQLSVNIFLKFLNKTEIYTVFFEALRSTLKRTIYKKNVNMKIT